MVTQVGEAEQAVNDRQHIESFMRTRVRTMMNYDWWQAGIQAGTSPSEWETISYGRDTSLAYLHAGSSMPDAIGQGFAAMYALAYADIKDSIRRIAGTRHAVTATADTDVYKSQLVGQPSFYNPELVDCFDLIARAPLNITQKKLAVMYSLGWTVTEMADDLGLSLRSTQRWWAATLPILKGQL